MIELMEAVRTLAPFSGVNVLWTTDQCCTYLSIEKTKFRAFQVLPDFPKAIRLPTEKGTGHPRYKASDVVDWANSYQERN